MDFVDDDEVRSVVFAPLRSFGEELHPGCLSGVRKWQDVVDRSVEMCGSKLKAWRALCHEHICVTLSSFANIIRHLGVQADRFPIIFEHFVQRGDGTVSLHDWDPVMCRLFLRIKREYLNTWTNTASFTTSIGDALRESQTDNTVIHKPQFIEHLMELNVEEDEADAMFDALAPYPGVPLMPFSVLHWVDDWLAEDLGLGHFFEGSTRPMRSYLLQTQTLTTQWEVAKKQRLYRERETQKDIGRVITTGKSLRDILRKRFWNLIRGWRAGFGVDFHCVGRNVVLKACERLRLKVKGTRVWHDLTSQNSHQLSLEQFAPHEMSLVRRFLMFFDDPIDVFTRYFGQSAGKHEWIDKMHSTYGIAKELSKSIFEYFTLEPSAHAIMLSDIVCLSYGKAPRQTLPSFLCTSLRSEDSSVMIFERGSKLLLQTARSQRAQSEAKNRREILQKTLSFGPRSLTEALEHIITYHDNIVRLVRRLFGDTSLDLTWQRFCIVFRTLKYTGNIRHLFTQLDQDKDGVVLLREWVPDVEAKLSWFQNELTHRYPTPQECFRFFDADKNGSLDNAEWRIALSDFADMTASDSNTLFSFIAKKPDGHIALSDIEWLYGALRRRPRGIVDKGISGYLAAFLNIISSKRTKAQGWRDMADVSARGICRWADFVLACTLHDDEHRIDNLRVAWMAIVKKIRRPFLSYADVDAKTAKALLAFKSVMLKKHSSVKSAMESVFSPKFVATPVEFADALRDLGFHGDPVILQSWVTERLEGDIVLRPWSLCVLDTWVEDCFDPTRFASEDDDALSALIVRHKQRPSNDVINERETRFLREYILDQLDAEATHYDQTHTAAEEILAPNVQVGGQGD
eukprot:GEMP01009434.1.p1 GENE.GEMP01009434.1~~GEMP01009434.1.p1  ORF type:complete len:855 (+),score=212.46 GEMP01009434.1:216-2780(+)